RGAVAPRAVEALLVGRERARAHRRVRAAVAARGEARDRRGTRVLELLDEPGGGQHGPGARVGHDRLRGAPGQHARLDAVDLLDQLRVGRRARAPGAAVARLLDAAHLAHARAQGVARGLLAALPGGEGEG